MSQGDRSYHTHQAHDPYAQQLGADPNMRPPRTGRSAVAGLGAVLVLIVAVIAGMSLVGGGDPAQAPAASESAPAADAQDAPVAPNSGEQGAGAPDSQ